MGDGQHHLGDPVAFGFRSEEFGDETDDKAASGQDDDGNRRPYAAFQRAAESTGMPRSVNRAR